MNRTVAYFVATLGLLLVLLFDGGASSSGATPEQQTLGAAVVREMAWASSMSGELVERPLPALDAPGERRVFQAVLPRLTVAVPRSVGELRVHILSESEDGTRPRNAVMRVELPSRERRVTFADGAASPPATRPSEIPVAFEVTVPDTEGWESYESISRDGVRSIFVSPADSDHDLVRIRIIDRDLRRSVGPPRGGPQHWRIQMKRAARDVSSWLTEAGSKDVQPAVEAASERCMAMTDQQLLDAVYGMKRTQLLSESDPDRVAYLTLLARLQLGETAYRYRSGERTFYVVHQRLGYCVIECDKAGQCIAEMYLLPQRKDLALDETRAIQEYLRLKVTGR